MRIVGLITEYNPFHNGHLYHLVESKRHAGADAAVAVMSGHFLQRGEPALVDKWLRTEMALAAGVDVVLELPFPFACNSAPHFAMGAVRLLDALGVVDALCFGSESGNLMLLQQAATLIIEKSEEIEAVTRRQLGRGVNYPTARAAFLNKNLLHEASEAMASPNNILGIEYLRALQILNSPIKPFTVARLGPGYHSLINSGNIMSATGLRKRLEAGQQILQFLPGGCEQTFSKAVEDGHNVDKERFFTALQTLLLQEPKCLNGLYQLEAGLKNRLSRAALSSGDYATLVERTKSRHWTRTRIQRVLSYVLLQVADAEMNAYLNSGPLYLRLLGFSEQGQRCLAKARKKKRLPLISDPSRAGATLSRFYQDQPYQKVLAEQMLAVDLRATRLFDLLLHNRPRQHLNRDFHEPVRRI